MALSPEQVIEIKKQILSQVENSQMENKESVKKSIQEMNEEELESFLKANNIPIEGLEDSGSESSKCVFCSIGSRQIPSYIIEETDNAVAVLELNPVSEGHSIVIPKKHLRIDELPKSVMALAQKVGKRIKKKLKSDDIKIETSGFQGHSMINIIPMYEGKNFEKRKASEEELGKLHRKLEVKKRGSRKKKVKAVAKDDLSKLFKVKFRIP